MASVEDPTTGLSAMPADEGDLVISLIEERTNDLSEIDEVRRTYDFRRHRFTSALEDGRWH